MTCHDRPQLILAPQQSLMRGRWPPGSRFPALLLLLTLLLLLPSQQAAAADAPETRRVETVRLFPCPENLETLHLAILN